MKDPYVAEMKAVILSISPDAAIVDVTHQVKKFDVRMGAYVLASASPYFSKGTIHVAVVDPGVGTKRKPLVIETENAYFIGPDNGLLMLAAKNAGKTLSTHTINNPRLALPNVSHTFQGRDLFAPAAAHLANGVPPVEFGPAVSKTIVPRFAKVARGRGAVVGEIIYVDDFGNVVTNFAERHLQAVHIGNIVKIKLGRTNLNLVFCKAYAEVERHKPLALIGSHGFLEISVNQGDAAQAYTVMVGDRVTLYRS